MSTSNLFDMVKTPRLPSPQYLHQKNQSAVTRLYREILMKEYQFRHCRVFDEDIQKRIFEKELGELYNQLMKPFKDSEL